MAELVEKKAALNVRSNEHESGSSVKSEYAGLANPAVPVQYKSINSEDNHVAVPVEADYGFEAKIGAVGLPTSPMQMATQSPPPRSFKAPPLQFNASPVLQRQEEEEPLQGKMEQSVQMQSEEEEPLQGKMADAVQMTPEPSNGLPGGVQSKMEGAMGADFSNVNIHKNSQSASDVGALAYAQGNDVHFAPGQYDPQSTAGQELIGHELAHVVQQREGRVQPTTQTKGLPVNDDKGLEAEADALGSKAAQMKMPEQSSQKSAPGQHKSDTAQLKDVSLPEKLGPAQSGPIAHKGAGDKDAFSPNDVNQGSIGDCYFLASLMAVANTNPDLLRKAIVDNKNGTFNVKLYKVSEESFLFFWKKKVFTPTIITLYPTFPVAVDGKDAANPDADANPAHAHGGDQDDKGKTELWVRLIEKAYALLMGSYSKIGKGGFGADALEALTGTAYKEEVNTKDTKSRIIEMVKEGVPIEVGTKPKLTGLSTDTAKFAKENSLVGGHAYAVMSADDSGIKVRNPWGTGARNAEPVLTWAQYYEIFNQFSNKQ